MDPSSTSTQLEHRRPSDDEQAGGEIRIGDRDEGGGSPVGAVVGGSAVALLGAAAAITARRRRRRRAGPVVTGSSVRLPRALHPGAWWIWALGLATAASRTTNPLLLALVLVVVAQVVAARRGEAPVGQGASAPTCSLGLVVDRHPRRLPDRARRLVRRPRAVHPPGGAAARRRRRASASAAPVTLEGVLAAAYDGLRLATLLVCVGAANVLADPKRLLKAVPAALHEVGVAITVSLSVAPQLIESGQRVRRGPSAAGRGRAPDRRSSARCSCPCSPTPSTGRSSSPRPWTAGATAAPAPWPLPSGPPPARSLLGGPGRRLHAAPTACSTAPPRASLGLPMLRVRRCCCRSSASVLSGRRVERTRYRPDPWLGPEWAVAGVGVAVAAVVLLDLGGRPDAAGARRCSRSRWPDLPIVPALGHRCSASLPAWLAPPVDRPARGPHAATRRAGPPSAWWRA